MITLFSIFLMFLSVQDPPVYKITYLRKDTKAKEKVEDLPFANKQMIIDLLEEVEYTLFVNREASLFFSSSYQIYHDKQKKLWLKKTKLPDGRWVIVKYDSLSFEWKVEKTPEKLGNYTVYKAVTTYKNEPVIAWFTPEIPVDGGPEFFHGLPGLILALKWGSYTYTATKIERTNDKIRRPEAPEQITEKEFEEELRKSGINIGGGDKIKVIILNK